MIADPYKVLGVPQTATDDELKKACRTLSKKYHPDANLDNVKYAEQKFKEVQEAYRQIMDARQHGGSGMGGQGNPYGGYGGQSNPYGGQGNPFGGYGGQRSSYGYDEQEEDYGPFGSFFGFGGQQRRQTGYGQQGYSSQSQYAETNEMRAARNYIAAKQYQEAFHVLNGISDRDARWYYYSALANLGIGNNVTAEEHAQRAADMEPGNEEYRSLLSRMSGNGSWYQNMGAGYGRNMKMGSCCVEVCVANALCTCCCRPF